MAKRRSGKGKTIAKSSLASRAAAVRWYMLRIEARALELAITNEDYYLRVSDVLRKARRSLELMERSQSFAGCEPPLRRCEDNVCRPDCDDERFPGGGLSE